MKVLLIILGVLMVAALVVGFKFSRFGVETPEYEVLTKEGAFEIREYPTMMLASTPMENWNPQESTSFMRLFGYISGKNESEQKIAMTSPVITSQANDGRQMSFVVPKDIADKGVPAAESELVEITTMPGGKFAAYRFSGTWDVQKFEEAKTKIMAWMEKQNLAPVGEPMIANYDPPYTPSFLRRNEILVRING